MQQPKQPEKELDFMAYRGIDSAEIPNIDIYMDQLLTFFEESYGFFRRDPKESILTKSMINNYVKAGIMDKPIKKKYNKNLIKKLMMIYNLKQVLSFQDIKNLLVQAEKTDLETSDLYQRFLDTENLVYQQLEDLYKTTVTQETEREALLQTILSLSTEACAKKRLAEKLLDKLKSDPPPTSKEKPLNPNPAPKDA